MGLKCLKRISKWIWETEKGLEWETWVREMGFAISPACCEAGDCHYLPKTTSYLEPSESTFLAGPPCPGCFCWPKAPAHPRGRGDLPGSGRVEDVRGCSRGAGGSQLPVRVEGTWGRLGRCSECESGTPLRGRARFQSILCPKMLLWYNFFWLFASPEGSLMHQCIFPNWVI